jgi:RimJ/RimL family protein N-acetyltransferase
MQADPVTTFTEAARFLNLPAEPARIEKAIRFSDFRELARQEEEKGFRERPQHTERFFREGTSGGWRDKLTVAQFERIVADHGEVMRRLGYLDADGQPSGPNGISRTRTKPVQGDAARGGDGTASWQGLETSRFVVRPMTAADVNDDYVGWWNDAALQAGLNHLPRGWNRLEAENHVRSFDGRNRFHMGIYRKHGPMVGFLAIILHQEGRVANLNMVVGNKSYWGKGVPDEVLPPVFDHFFASMGVHKFKCEVLAFNRSSIAGVKRLGFALEGVLREEREAYDGASADLHVFGLLKGDWEKRADAAD